MKKGFSEKTRRIPFFVIILCVLISFAGICTHGLWTPDEPREAAIMLEMSRTGEFLVPRLAGEPFVEKPPLYYIVGALAIKTFSGLIRTTWALRLTSAVWGLMTIGCVFMLVRRLFGKNQGVLAALILATMPGFVNITHWLLVDNALLFFTAAAMWLFAEAYTAKREYCLIPAGAMLAGAFLSKGFIGLAIVFPGWLGLFIPWLTQTWPNRTKNILRKTIILHIAAGATLAILCAIWMIAFRQTAGEDLWEEWFWTNHFGRFRGKAAHLGHARGPFYYIPNIIMFTLPWLACIAAGVVAGWKTLRRSKFKNPALLCALLWGIGGIVMLSLSVTKRGIYLGPLLPAFAMLAAVGINSVYRRTTEISMTIWSILCVTALAILAAAPFFTSFIPDPSNLYGIDKNEITRRLWTSGFIAFGGAIACIALFTARNIYRPARTIAITALSLIILMNTLFPILDLFKNYQNGFVKFSGHLAEYQNIKPAAWNFDETTKACFYYYSSLVFPHIDSQEELDTILAGQHTDFNSVVAYSRNELTAENSMENATVLESVKIVPKRWITLVTGSGAD